MSTSFSFLIRDGLESDLDACLELDHTYQTEYDSRNNVVRTLDPNNIETLVIYDPLSRPIQVVRDMNGNGADPLEPADILIEQVFD
ncbi:MAG: hypothetical protein IH822_10020, partial [Chloroflexi bacterium]|nr:hypothetical protein [Chloroflexota bacterium]